MAKNKPLKAELVETTAIQAPVDVDEVVEEVIETPAVEEPAAPAPQPKLIDFLRSTIEALEAADRTLELAKSFAWHVVIVPDAGLATCHSAETAEEVAAIARPHVGPGRQAQAFFFQAIRCRTTAPPHPYLVTPDGKIPLFDIAASDEQFVEDGALSLPEPVPVAPPADDEDEQSTTDS